MGRLLCLFEDHSYLPLFGSYTTFLRFHLIHQSTRVTTSTQSIQFLVLDRNQNHSTLGKLIKVTSPPPTFTFELTSPKFLRPYPPLFNLYRYIFREFLKRHFRSSLPTSIHFTNNLLLHPNSQQKKGRVLPSG